MSIPCSPDTPMNKDKIDTLETVDGIISIVQRVNSCLRSGQFILADRDVNNVLGQLKAMDEAKLTSIGSYVNVRDLMQHLKRTSVFLQDIVSAYGENDSSLDMMRQGRKALIDDMRGDSDAK